MALSQNMKHKTDFRRNVFTVVAKIPTGSVLTYKQIAKLAGKPKAWRAVGNMMLANKNPHIPCHRVVKSNGDVGGYNRGQKQKIALLKKENVVISANKKVSFNN